MEVTVIREPFEIKEKGMWVRLIKVEMERAETLPFWVESAPAYMDGHKPDDEEFSVFGGSVGYDNSTFKTLKDANGFIKLIQQGAEPLDILAIQERTA